jgi:hypothetical protein
VKKLDGEDYSRRQAAKIKLATGGKKLEISAAREESAETGENAGFLPTIFRWVFGRG